MKNLIGKQFTITTTGYTVTGHGTINVTWEITDIEGDYAIAKQIKNNAVMKINPDYRDKFLIDDVLIKIKK